MKIENMYILTNLELVVEDNNHEINLKYKLTYKIDKFGNFSNVKTYTVFQNVNEQIISKIQEEEILNRYF